VHAMYVFIYTPLAIVWNWIAHVHECAS